MTEGRPGRSAEIVGRAQRVLLGIMFQQRTDPSWRAVKRLVEGGALGEVYRLSFATSAYRPQAYYRAAAWRGTWKDESLLVASGDEGRRALELANAILLASCTPRHVTLPLHRQRYARLLRRLRGGKAMIDGACGHPPERRTKRTKRQ